MDENSQVGDFQVKTFTNIDICEKWEFFVAF
jgi:hypothetical protein